MDDITGRIIAYEEGTLDEEGTLALFQELVSTGVVWGLQGHYGRTALALIDNGLIERPTGNVPREGG